MGAGAAESDWLDLHSEFRPATATYPATNKQTQKPKIKKTRTNQPNTEKVPRGWRGSSLWEEYIHLAVHSVLEYIPVQKGKRKERRRGGRERGGETERRKKEVM